jgi:hypothetical protein
MVTGGVGSVKVYFDHYSGGNGQRVYANCKGGDCHDNCFQWRQCADFGSRDEISRYFFAWATSHSMYADRHGHMKYRPTSDDITRAGPVHITEF